MVAICFGLSSGRLLSAPTKNPFKPPTAEQIKKVTQAAPDKAAAKPMKSRKLLVFSRSPGFKHEVIPITTAAIEIMGKKK